MSSPRPGTTGPVGAILPARPNLRGLCGLPLDGGRRIAAGTFFRAPALVALTPDEAARIAALDLAMVIDFRHGDEVRDAPVDLPTRAEAARLSLPIVTAAAARALAAPAITHDTADATMIEVYRDFVRASADTYATFLHHLADAPGPALFHCTAGKDRTGFAAALVLSALGAARDTVMADFLATASLWTPDPGLRARIPAGAQAALLGVRQAYLAAALDELDLRHGGAPGFARDVLGDAGLRAWTSRVTTPHQTAPAVPRPAASRPQEMT